MIAEKRSMLQPLIDSADGVHLTIYLSPSASGMSLEDELRQSLQSVSFDLEAVMSREKCQKFLQPIGALLEDTRFFEGVRGNLGLFRSTHMFRMISIPIEVNPISVIATTFHVKPLLRWMQIDREFLLLHLEAEGAALYQGSQSDLHCKERIDFVKACKSREYQSRSSTAQLVQKIPGISDKVDTLLDWTIQRTHGANLPLYVSGEPSLCEGLMKQLSASYINKPVHHIPAHERKLTSICLEIRAIMRKQARQTLEQAFIEFRSAEEINLGDRNIFQIAKAAIEGRVKKLIVADGVQIFGRIHPRTGTLTINRDNDPCRDDDILDDLAQTVLHHGGEVVVATQSQIPRGRPALAILYDQGSDLSLTLPYYDFSSPPEWRLSI